MIALATATETPVGVFLITCLVVLGVVFLGLVVYIVYATCCKNSDEPDSNDRCTPNKRSNFSPKRLSNMKGQQQGKAKTSSWKSWRSPKGKTSAGRKTTPGKGSAKIVNRPTPSKNKTKFCLPSYLSSTVELPSIKTDKNSSLQKEVTIRTQMGMTPGQPESLSASSPSGTSEKGKKGKPAAASAALEQSRTTKSNKRNSGVQRKVTKLANNFKKDIKMKSSTSKSKSACQWKATQCKAPKR
ncbi:hypothetical protein TYRP_002002 [Tyrophagus putrescentiae]|nr:hypothetical protein TYRP_002002 [Tyrophagus putrescentiae]